MKFLKLEKKNKISYVSFKRTKSLNALNSQTLKELIDLNKELERDSKTKVVVYRSEGKNFSAGADIKEKQKKLSKLELWKSNLGKEAIESILKINQITHLVLMTTFLQLILNIKIMFMLKLMSVGTTHRKLDH